MPQFQSLFKKEFIPNHTVDILKINDKEYVNIRKLTKDGRPMKDGVCLKTDEYKDILGLLMVGPPDKIEELKRKVTVDMKGDKYCIKLDKKGYKSQEINLSKKDMNALVTALNEHFKN